MSQSLTSAFLLVFGSDRTDRTAVSVSSSNYQPELRGLSQAVMSSVLIRSSFNARNKNRNLIFLKSISLNLTLKFLPHMLLK